MPPIKRPSGFSLLLGSLLIVALGAGTLLGHTAFAPNALEKINWSTTCEHTGAKDFRALLSNTPYATAAWSTSSIKPDKSQEFSKKGSCDVRAEDGRVLVTFTNVQDSTAAQYTEHFRKEFNLSADDSIPLKVGDGGSMWPTDSVAHFACKSSRLPAKNFAVSAHFSGIAKGSGPEHQRLVADLTRQFAGLAMAGEMCGL